MGEYPGQVQELLRELNGASRATLDLMSQSSPMFLATQGNVLAVMHQKTKELIKKFGTQC